jgi:hypothetical protein
MHSNNRSPAKYDGRGQLVSAATAVQDDCLQEDGEGDVPLTLLR